MRSRLLATPTLLVLIFSNGFASASKPAPQCVSEVQKAIGQHVECLLNRPATLAPGEETSHPASCNERFHSQLSRVLARDRAKSCSALRARDIAKDTHLFVKQTIEASTSRKPKPSAVLLLPNARTDRNFSEASYRGALAAIPEAWSLKVIDDTGKRSETDWHVEFFAALAEGSELVLATGVEYEEVLVKAMAQYPNLRVASVPTGPKGVDAERLLVLPLDTKGAGGVLAGEVAVLLTESDHVAFIGGIESVDGVQAKKFVDRVNEIAPDIHVDVIWVGSFGDPVRTRGLTVKAIEAGADVVLAGADTVTAQVASERGVKSIGWVYDPRDSKSPLGNATAAVRFDVVWGNAVTWLETGLPPGEAAIDSNNFWKATLYPH